MSSGKPVSLPLLLRQLVLVAALAVSARQQQQQQQQGASTEEDYPTYERRISLQTPAAPTPVHCARYHVVTTFSTDPDDHVISRSSMQDAGETCLTKIFCIQETLRNASHALLWNTCAELYDRRLPTGASTHLYDSCHPDNVNSRPLAGGAYLLMKEHNTTHSFNCCHDENCCNVEMEARYFCKKMLAVQAQLDRVMQHNYKQVLDDSQLQQQAVAKQQASYACPSPQQELHKRYWLLMLSAVLLVFGM